jgi:hypothetical protein
MSVLPPETPLKTPDSLISEAIWWRADVCNSMIVSITTNVNSTYWCSGIRTRGYHSASSFFLKKSLKALMFSK